ncbi:MAG: hypothetical protein NVS9B9_26070 [Ktedonobacteraceae bacterium]
MAAFLGTKFGISVSVRHYDREDKRYYMLCGGVESKRRLYELCRPFIHPSMAYKFDTSENRGVCVFCHSEFWFYEQGPAAVTCGSQVCSALRLETLHVCRVESTENSGFRWVYDFTVADNHNFFANRLLNKNCVDEIDLADPRAYEEAKMIPAPYKGLQPVTLLVSTRKYGFGLVQKEINNAVSKAGVKNLEVRHWNIIDVTEPCPAERHQPDKPKIPIYRSEEDLRAISEADYSLLDDQAREKYVRDEGYEGCLSRCTLFAACRGRLATEQKCTSSLLKPIDHVMSLFANVSVGTAQAQLLCLKPSSEGLIYPRFDRAIHMLSAAKIAEKLTGEKYPDSFSKSDLIALIKTREVPFYAGVDFGFSHLFAVVMAAVDGAFVYIIDVVAVPGFELSEKIELLKQRYSDFNAKYYADSAYPSDIKSFVKAGFRMVGVEKPKGSVVGGIEVVRTKLMPAVGQPQLFILQGDEGCEILAKALQQYHWKMDAGGNMTDVPDEKDDDLADSCRYLCMSLFSPKGKVMVAIDPGPSNKGEPHQQDNWMKNIIRENLGEAPAEQKPSVSGKKGGLIWSF